MLERDDMVARGFLKFMNSCGSACGSCDQEFQSFQQKRKKYVHTISCKKRKKNPSFLRNTICTNSMYITEH
jgi:hypothetical protein